MAELADVLLRCSNADDTIRNSAEAFLRHAAETNFPNYLGALATVLCGEEFPEIARQQAGLQLKNALTSHDPAVLERRQRSWLLIEAATRGQIKTLLVKSLYASVEGARNSASQCIGAIGAIELNSAYVGDVPQWPELIPGLLGVVEDAGTLAGSRAATIRAIGYLADEVPSGCLEVDDINKFLTAVFRCSQPDQEPPVRRAAQATMAILLQYAEDNFEREAERNAIMSCICAGTQDPDAQTRANAFMSMGRAVEHHYRRLGPYIEAMLKVVFPVVSSADKAPAMHALEVISQIATIESDEDMARDPECLRVCKVAIGPLVGVLTSIMTTVEEDEDEEDLSSAIYAAGILGDVCAAAGEDCIAPLMAFIQPNLGNPDWRYRDAAVLAFAKMTGAGKVDALAGLVNQALPALLGRLVGPTRDPSEPVRDTIAFTIGAFFENVPWMIDFGTHGPAVLSSLMAALDDAARVAAQASFALFSLADTVATYEKLVPPGRTVLSDTLVPFVAKLMNRAAGEDWDERNLRKTLFEAVYAVVETAVGQDNDTPAVLTVLRECMTRLQANVTTPLPAGDRDAFEERTSMQGALIGTITTCVGTLGGAVREVADPVLRLMLGVFDLPKAPHDDAIRCIASVATALGSEFEPYFAFAAPPVLKRLTDLSDVGVVQASVIAIGAIASAMDEAFAPIAKETVEGLLFLLTCDALPSDMKPEILRSVGDVCLVMGAHPVMHPVLPAVMTATDAAARAAEVLPHDNPDMAQVILDLREAILYTWTSIFLGFDDERYHEIARSNLPTIVKQIVAHMRTWSTDIINEATMLQERYTESGVTDHVAYDDVAGSAVLASVVGLMLDMTKVLGAEMIRPLLDPISDPMGNGWVRQAWVLDARWEKMKWEDDGEPNIDETGAARKTRATMVKRALGITVKGK